MATIFVQTNEGAAHDHAVRMGRSTASGIAAIVCYTGPPIVEVVDIKALTAATAGTECYRILESDIPQTDISNVSTLLEPELPEQLTGLHITALGYLLKNGVLWGYVPYRSEKGGLVKDNTFSWVMKLVCTSTDSPTLTINYSSLDLRELGERLYLSAYERLRTAFYVELCQFTAAPIHDDGECLILPLNESNITGSEIDTTIIARPLE